MSYIAMNARKKEGKTNDEWVTPPELVKKQIDAITKSSRKSGDIWFDPFKNSGVYYDNYPDEYDSDFTEILEGRDFFEYKGKVDIIVSNPPYSLFDKVWAKTIDLSPRIVSYVMSTGALTRTRMNRMKSAGYTLTKIHRFDVKAPNKSQREKGYTDWMPSIYAQWEKGSKKKRTDWTYDEEPYPFVEKSQEYHEGLAKKAELKKVANRLLEDAGLPFIIE